MMKTRSKKLNDPKRVTIIIEREDVDSVQRELEGTEITFSQLIRDYVQEFLGKNRIPSQHRNTEEG